MQTDNETGASLLARREYTKAIPLLRADLEKYPSNVRIRLQYADALAGAGDVDEAVRQYEQTVHFYEENGLMVQAIAVRKKAEKLQAVKAVPSSAIPAGPPPVEEEPRGFPKSPLFEDMSNDEREAVVKEMSLVAFEQGDIIITEGEQGSSLYVVVSGEVKVFTRGKRGDSVLLARLSQGDFFGEVSVLTGKPRTATITATCPTELLVLEKSKLDSVAARHPRIRTILDDFYRRRANHTVEAMIENLRKRES
jgi:hypothetical protein